jgi:hypothetical protein
VGDGWVSQLPDALVVGRHLPNQAAPHRAEPRVLTPCVIN